MVRYINKADLVANIEKRFDEYSSSILKHYDACTEARASELSKILIILNNLEVKEVDLEEIEVPRWFLENVENTLRIQYNINLEGKGETCQDRNIKESLNGVRKLLNGKELTGMERTEKLIPCISEVKDEIKIGETEIYLNDDGGEAPYDGKQWLETTDNPSTKTKSTLHEGYIDIYNNCGKFFTNSIIYESEEKAKSAKSNDLEGIELIDTIKIKWKEVL